MGLKRVLSLWELLKVLKKSLTINIVYELWVAVVSASTFYCIQSKYHNGINRHLICINLCHIGWYFKLWNMTSHISYCLVRLRGVYWGWDFRWERLWRLPIEVFTAAGCWRDSENIVAWAIKNVMVPMWLDSI